MNVFLFFLGCLSGLEAKDSNRTVHLLVKKVRPCPFSNEVYVHWLNSVDSVGRGESVSLTILLSEGNDRTRDFKIA